MFTRQKTHKVMVGNVQIGGQNKVVIQSMTNTKTSDITKTLKQVTTLHAAGCELVRVAVLDQTDVEALKVIAKKSPCPIVADIHYSDKFAIESIKAGVAKIRINPGNISLNKLKEVVNAAKKYKVAIRIGINAGSFNIKTMINEAVRYVKQFESWGFNQIVVSLKTSDPLTVIKLYKEASNKISYPLHLGVTEAGIHDDAVIKHSIGLAPLLLQGIGDTIRVSVSGDPTIEPIIAKKILSNVGLYKKLPNLITCPNCGRLQWDIQSFLKQVNNLLITIYKPIAVAVLGCAVNGIGECARADVGAYGNKTDMFIYYKGNLHSKIQHKKAFPLMKHLIENFAI